MNQFLVHDDGVMVPELEKVYRNRMVHDPSDMDAARRLADDPLQIRLGVFFRDSSRPRYEETRQLPTHTVAEKLALLDKELDLYAV